MAVLGIEVHDIESNAHIGYRNKLINAAVYSDLYIL